MGRLITLPADQTSSIDRAVRALHRGAVVAFPTDTVYGLGAHSAIASAIDQLYAVKGRERQKAIPLLIASVEDLTDVAVRIPEIAWRLAGRFWPGPVTLVLSKAPVVLDVLTGGADSVAVRVPAHAVAQQLILSLGAPLAATSANLSGRPEAVSAAEVREALGERVQWILDGGRCPDGVASTLVDCTQIPPVIRRRGASVGEVESFLRQIAELRS
jgi:L-threonylcarbamoyladenylate synthase